MYADLVLRKAQDSVKYRSENIIVVARPISVLQLPIISILISALEALLEVILILIPGNV